MDKIDKYETPDFDTMKAELIAIKESRPGNEELSLHTWMELVFQRGEVAFGMSLIERPTVRDTWILFDSLNSLKG